MLDHSNSGSGTNSTYEMDVMCNWFANVTCVSRLDKLDHEDETNSLSSSSPSCQVDVSYDSLIFQLNQVKEQLMPSAKACADAINNYNNYSHQSTKKYSTTPRYEFRKARSFCNPYESLGRGSSDVNPQRKRSRKRKLFQSHSSHGLSRFVNRSAIKLANIDAMLGFILTKSVREDDKNDPFTFVDLCGAPGGFSEYLLYRSHHHPAACNDEYDARPHDKVRKSSFGFGMSLIGKNSDGEGVPWDLDHLKLYHKHHDGVTTANNDAMHRQSIYDVCYGADGTGSIYNWQNVTQLQHDIQQKIDPTGNRTSLVHLVVADGGFDAQRDSNDQESIAFKLIVCQTAAALTLLRSGGVYVLKMFGFRNDATRNMLKCLYACFDQIEFVKPVSSRPASAERYLVCRGYSGKGDDWDGLAWREKVMNDRHESCTQEYPHLEESMNLFDIEMVKLNMATCRSIIDFLDRKREWVEQGKDISSLDFGEHRNQLNTSAYELAWQLNR